MASGSISSPTSAKLGKNEKAMADTSSDIVQQIEQYQEVVALLALKQVHDLLTKKAGIDLTNSENRATAEHVIADADAERSTDSMRPESPPSVESEQAAVASPARQTEIAHATPEVTTSEDLPSLKQVVLAMVSAKLLILERILHVLQSDAKLLDRLAIIQKEKRIRIKRQIEDQQQLLRFNHNIYEYLHVGILELRERIDTLNSISPDGTFTWVITDIAKKTEDAVQGTHPSFYSHPFYVHRYGYKLCLRMYLKGDGLGKNTHLSLFLVVMRSPWDNILRWPFQQKITLMLYDQNFKEHIIDAFRPDVTVASFQKPETNMNVASGSSLFVPLVIFDERQNTTSKFIVNDTMFLKVIIDVSDLASLKWVAP